jgi:uncharacterized membrane protein YdjX (TVP38/TMEM64 family)
VLEDIGWICLAYGIAFAMNLMPAFMPTTWMVLAFFRIQFGLPILPLTIGGALFSGLGRIVLARGTGVVHRRFFRRDSEMGEVKTYLDKRRNYIGLATFGYCLMPLPTNNLFVAAGVVGVSLARVMLGFWAGRVIADTVYVWTTDRVFANFEGVFEEFYSDWTVVLVQAVSLLGALLLIVVPWPRWILRWLNRGDAGATSRPDLPG